MGIRLITGLHRKVYIYIRHKHTSLSLVGFEFRTAMSGGEKTIPVLDCTATAIGHMAWTAEGLEFESLLLHIVQTGSGPHATSYPMDTGVFFPRDKTAAA
jgi:hypothetical protein